ncbi:MAG TPA: hypothetical protein EYG02_05025 [Henriciella marina]|uniref:hypothetical protein n=1 Tax=Henriciella sp. TaxID=1968823 RepID=UPI0017AD95C9|nr:hypothetical protein [Henriciella sp.]HIG21478.1 hypothetical protein [Henriciella sp.]HIK64373.1 hypothetical protein [Henriciella marina]
MSRKTRTALYAVLAFVMLVLLILSMAWYNGVNPFHPRTRMYWLAAVVAALYISLRGAIFVERIQYRRERKAEEAETPSRLSANIKDRMAARKARVAAAQKKAGRDKNG